MYFNTICIFWITGHELLETIKNVWDKLPEDFTICISGVSAESLPERAVSFDALLMQSLPVPVCKSARDKITLQSPVCYIYTSGTTGQYCKIGYMQCTTRFNMFWNTVPNTYYWNMYNLSLTPMFSETFKSERKVEDSVVSWRVVQKVRGHIQIFFFKRWKRWVCEIRFW
jgi:hypothetical protein